MPAPLYHSGFHDIASSDGVNPHHSPIHRRTRTRGRPTHTSALQYCGVFPSNYTTLSSHLTTTRQYVRSLAMFIAIASMTLYAPTSRCLYSFTIYPASFTPCSSRTPASPQHPRFAYMFIYTGFQAPHICPHGATFGCRLVNERPQNIHTPIPRKSLSPTISADMCLVQSSQVWWPFSRGGVGSHPYENLLVLMASN